MWGVVVLVVACLLIIGAVWAALDYGVFSAPIPPGGENPRAPRIIHLIYIPWDRNQKLLNDPLAFDQTYHQQLQQRFPRWRVMMWTGPLLHTFVEKHYPGLWDAATAAAARPTQLVDLFRWLLIYHWGGLYIQFGSVLHVEPERLLPREGEGVRLYTEFVWFSPILRHLPAWRFPCRGGRPEEERRVMNQLFSAVPRHPYIDLTWRTILQRMQKIRPQCDYDILFVGANAFVSELYEQKGRSWPGVALVNFWQTRHMATISSKGSWRTDHQKLNPTFFSIDSYVGKT